MSFKLGDAKPPGSGRQKGTPNKRTVAKVSEFLAERNINPADEILTIINEKKVVTDPATNLQRQEFALSSKARADLWLELLSFCHAKPKTIQFKRDDDEPDLSEFDGVATGDLMKVLTKPQKTGSA